MTTQAPRSTREIIDFTKTHGPFSILDGLREGIGETISYAIEKYPEDKTLLANIAAVGTLVVALQEITREGLDALSGVPEGENVKYDA
jgi:hypothetical protein